MSLRITDGAKLLGPLVWVRASLALSGIKAWVSFRAREKTDGTSDEVTRPASLVAPGERVDLGAGHPLRGIRGPSLVSMRLVEQDGWTLTEEIEIGECTEGTLESRIPFNLTVSAVIWVVAHEWTDQGPSIGLSGDVIFPRGVFARLAFQPLESRRSRIGEAGEELPLVRPGMTRYMPERRLVGRSPEHSWVSVRLEDANGDRVGSDHLIGRCELV